MAQKWIPLYSLYSFIAYLYIQKIFLAANKYKEGFIFSLLYSILFYSII